MFVVKRTAMKKGCKFEWIFYRPFSMCNSDIQNAAKWHATNVSFKGKKSTLTLVMAQTIFVMEQRHGLTSWKWFSFSSI